MGSGPQRRRDHFRHELVVPLAQLGRGKCRQRRQLEGEKRADVQRAGLVIAIEAVVLELLMGLVDGADAGQEAAPFVVAVDGQQGVVEVEEG